MLYSKIIFVLLETNSKTFINPVGTAPGSLFLICFKVCFLVKRPSFFSVSFHTFLLVTDFPKTHTRKDVLGIKELMTSVHVYSVQISVLPTS